jgi:hypothetical protein
MVAALAEVVDVRTRAAEQFGNLVHLERRSANSRTAAWHMLGT